MPWLKNKLKMELYWSDEEHGRSILSWLRSGRLEGLKTFEGTGVGMQIAALLGGSNASHFLTVKRIIASLKMRLIPASPVPILMAFHVILVKDVF
jgi:hypothetical protein